MTYIFYETTIKKPAMISYIFLKKKVKIFVNIPPAAAACRQVLPKSSGVSISNPTRMNTSYIILYACYSITLTI